MPGTNNFSNTFCITTASTLTYNQNFDMNGGTTCVGPNVTFSSGGGNYNGNWTINNYGSFSRGLSLNSGQTFNNYGTFTGSITLNGGTVVNYNGATFTPSSFTFNSNSSFTNNLGGTATISSSLTLNSGTTFVNNGTLTVSGLTLNSSASATLGGTTTINGSVTNNGTISVAGLLTVTGNYNQNSSGSISSSSSAQCNALSIAGTIQGQGTYNGNNGLALNKALSPACGSCLTNGATVLGAPANQINGPVLTASANSISGTITNAGGSPAATHYIVLRRFGSAVTDQPADFRSYSVGSTIGSSTVVAANAIGTLGYTDANVIASNGCGTYYYAVFPMNSNGTCGTYNRTINATNSNSVTIASTGGSIGTSTSVCSGNNSGALTLSGYIGSIVRWESSVSPFTTWTSITNTTNTYTSGTLTQTTQFRAVVNAGTSCSNANSSAATITVNPSPTNIAPAAVSSTVCPATGTNIQIAGSQSGVNYLLRYESNYAAVGTAVAGTGGTINLPTGSVSGTTTYNVLAINTTTGCFAKMSPTVTLLLETTPPVINCPYGQTISLGSSCTATLPSYTSLATVSDNCTAAGAIVVTQSPVAGTTVSGTGSQTITLTARDEAGNSSNCTFTLTAQDVTPPVINCPSNITTTSTTGLCGAAVSYSISATDNCTGSTSCIPANISSNYILVGTYGGHTYYRSNFSANWATAKANAIALGGHLLTLSSAAENNLFNGLGSHWAGFTDEAVEGTFVWVTGESVVFTNWAPGEPNDYNASEDYMQLNWNASYNWNDYTGTASYPYVVEFECVSPTLTMVSGLASGSVFPVGTTTVTYNATDGNGNTSSNCSFTVTVNDVTPPTITCPANISVNAAAGACDAVVTYSAPVATDNCGSCSSSPTISGYASLGIYNGSAYYISTAAASCTAAFTAASALGATVATINSAGENTFVRNAANTAGYTGSYLIGQNDVAVEGTFVGFSGETLSYTNWNGGEPNNSGSNEDYTYVLNTGLWNDVSGTTSGNYVIKISCITPVKTSGLASGSTFPIGTSTINYSATDPSGNTSTCSFTVTVSLNPSSLSKTVTAASATICEGTSTNISVASSDNGISYQLRNNATNANVGSPVAGTGGTINLATGNLTATTTFNIYATGSSCSYQLTNAATVTVNQAATVTPGSTLTACQSASPSAITLSGASVGGGASTAAWSITSGGGTLSNTAQTATPETVTYTPAANFSGTVTLTLTTNDPAGPCGTISNTRTITVNALPVNKTPTAASASICSGSGTNIQIPTSEAGVNYQLRNNTGNVNIGSTVAGTGGTINLPTGNLTSATTFNVLATNATTGCNIQMTATVTVSMDNIAPVITCPATQTLSLNSSCSATLPSYTSLATVSDNCTATGSITVTQSPVAGTTVSSAGTQVITLTATDASGNSNTCSFNVTKQDVTPPVMSCPSNITVNSTTGVCGAAVTYTVSATDNCSAGSGCAPASISGYTLIGSYNGHTYFRSTAGALWPTAKTNAEALGAHLVTISSAGENAFLAGLGTHWAGFTDEVTEGTWVWVTGEPIVYTSWAAGEPNNSGNQDYMVLNFSGTNWDDQGTTTTVTQPYIIEFDCMNLNLVAGYSSGSIFPVGTTTVTYNATDAAGNTSSNCSFTVTVNDVTPPTITCPANISVNAAAGACDAVVTYSAPVATDNCGSCSSSPTISGYASLGIYNGSAYYISTAAASCTAAFTAASALGATVATINSAGENTFVRNAANTAGYTGSYLIGQNDVAVEGTFVGFSGEALSYTNWNGGEPNNSGSNEDYTYVLNTGLWNDVTGTTSGNYVIKISCITPVKTSGLASGSTFPIGTSTINYSATDPSGNTSTCSFTVTVAVNPASLARTVTTASASVCAGTGTNISIASSDNGISYQLRNNATNANVGSPVTGTGGTINLATGNLTTTTTFNILATGSSCSYQLTNTATVTVNALPVDKTITAATSAFCTSGSTNIQVAASQSGVNYQLRNNATNALVGTAVAGNSGRINLPTGTLSSTTTFNVLATNTANICNVQMSSTVTVTINALPINKTPTAASASVCSGSGTNIQIPTSEAGVNYQLRNNTVNVNIGSSVAGTGGTINLPTGNLTAATTFNVLATDATTGCNVQMTSTVTVNINALPTDKTPTAVSASVCSGSSTNIQIATSQSGVSYQLRNNATNALIGSAVNGNTFTISLPTGNLTAATTFNVLATITATSCSVQMANTITVTINSAGQWVGSTTGDWNTASNWCGGVPGSSTSVNIPTGVTVNIQSANATASSVVIAPGASLVMTGAYNLNITAGGTFNNGGTFTATASTGTVSFLGGGTISGTTTFKNIDANGALDFGTASTVSGTFSIQTGGSVTGHSPTYTCPTAILAYKPGSTFARGLEWTSNSSGAGYPANVFVQNNTTINFPAAGDGYICYDMQIDAGSTLNQNYSGGSAKLSVGRNVTITGTLQLGGASGGDINVGGNWTRNTGGIFIHNDRKVTFDGPSNFSGNGTAMSTISAPFSSVKDNEGGFGGENFAHLWVNKTNATDSVVLLSNVTVNRELGLTRGTFSLRNSDVTIVSNSTRTADIAPVTTPANIAVRYGGTGRFVVQRFVQNPTAVRSWRLLTAPLQSSNAPSINTAWQEGVVNPDKTQPNANGGIYNPWPGYGTHITGPGGTYSAANGFDHGTNTASVLYANAGITAWTNPSSTIAAKVTDQQGWMLFVRGDRGFVVGNQYTPSQNAILEPKGKVNVGNVTVPVTANKLIIGNPYAAEISLLNVDIAGTLGKNSTYYMWDPKYFTSFTQPGKWVTFTGMGSSFVQTSSASAYATDGTIESGQAFAVDVTTAGNITFHESDKKALSSSLIGVANRPSSSMPFAMFRSDIYANSNGTYSLTDGVLNIFNEAYTNETDEADAKKLITFNTKESLSILRDTIKMAIEKRRDIQQTDTIFFSMTKFNQLPYQFKFTANDFAPGYEAFLEDKYTGSRSQVSTNGETIVNFDINADSLSKAADRFRVVFRNTLIVLPVTFTDVSAWQQNKDIAVQWKVADELNIQQYDIEKSLDGIHFERAGTTPAKVNSAGTNAYNWLDKNTVAGDNYYRIASRETNNNTRYSQVVKVNIGKEKGVVAVYPNPVTDGIIKLKFTNMVEGKYTARLFSINGELVAKKEINHSGNNGLHELHAKNSKGAYNLELSKNGEEKIVIKVILQ